MSDTAETFYSPFPITGKLVRENLIPNAHLSDF